MGHESLLGVLARYDKASDEMVGFTLTGLKAILGKPASSKAMA